jgi:two-component system autoinducer 2 sensor kinase/phosphatase LuxQ
VGVIFGVLLFVTVSLALWVSYRVSSQAVSQEIERNLLQAHTTVRGLVDARMGLIGAHVTDAARNPLFVSLAEASDQRARQQIAPFLDSQVGAHLDLFFALDHQKALLFNQGMPYYGLEALIGAIDNPRELTGDYRFVSAGRESALLTAAAMVDPATGREIGFLVGGIALAANTAFLEQLKTQSESDQLLIVEHDRVLARLPGGSDDMPPRVLTRLDHQTQALHQGNLHLMYQPLTQLTQKGSVGLILGVRDAQFGTLKQRYVVNFLILTAALLPLLVLAAWILHRVSAGAIGSLLEYARAIEHGQRHPYRAGVVREYNQLGYSLGAMLERLSDQQSYIDKLFAGAAGPLVVWDETLSIIRVNAAMAEFVGRDIEAIVGTSMDDFSGQIDHGSAASMIRMAVEEGVGVFDCEMAHPQTDKTRYAIWNITPVLRRDGSLLAVLGQAQEITARKEAEEVVRRARDEAQAASRAKGHFLATVSHELRTPLNVILGYSELLLEEGLEDASQKDVTRIRQAGFDMLSMVDDVLNLANIDTDRAVIDANPVAVEMLFEKLSERFQEVAAKRGNRLVFEGGVEAGTIQTDPAKLQRALAILLDNGCKFTENGTIVLRAQRRDNELLFEVRDSGIGMSPEQISSLFTPFWQADSSSTRRYGGLGIGLALCAHFVKLLGGTITVSSTPGKGSAFTITLKDFHG